MKDWKTYAIIALAAWCAWLTYYHSDSQTEERAIKRSCEELKNSMNGFLDRLDKKHNHAPMKMP